MPATMMAAPVALPMQLRRAPILPATVNTEARSVDVVFTTGAAVRRRRWIGWDTSVPFDEILEVSERAVDLTRLNAGAPALDTLFQLTKRYASGAQSWTRAITKPVAGTVTIALNGTPQASGWSVSTATGLVTFATAPAAGVTITAGFEFDVPVRFDTDVLDVTLDLERLGSITSIPLLEIRT